MEDIRLAKHICWWLLLFSLLLLVFCAAPESDLAITSFFHRYLSFCWGKQILPALDIIVYTVGCCWSAILAWVLYRYVIRSEDNVKAGLALLKVTYVGAVGLVGGIGLIQLSKVVFGRARPMDLLLFGQGKFFSTAWEISDQCITDCSFMSGHAAIGFMVYSLMFIQPRKATIYFIIGSITGMLFGMTRVVVGKHFISDVLFSAIVVYGIAILFAMILLRDKNLRYAVRMVEFMKKSHTLYL